MTAFRYYEISVGCRLLFCIEFDRMESVTNELRERRRSRKTGGGRKAKIVAASSGCNLAVDRE